MKIKQVSLLILFVLQGCGVVLAREWKDNTGKFKIEAELREVRGKEIVLVRSERFRPSGATGGSIEDSCPLAVDRTYD